MELSYSLVPLDSDIFGFPVAQISSIRVPAGADLNRDFHGFEAWRDSLAVELVSCRLDSLLLRESMLLEAHGFRFVEMTYRIRFDAVQRTDFAPQDLQVHMAEAADLPRIEEIARAAFTTGRHALDGRLDPALGPRRYAAWVRSAFEHPAQRLLKATADDRIVGFFVTETLPGECCYWHLTAVSPDAQGQGVGRRLWRAMLARHRVAGLQSIETCVSAHNLRVLNLYSTLGFHLTRAEMTFHWVRGR